jgi:flavodoxin I
MFMKKILILFWPKGGNVHNCAKLIYEKLDTNEAELISLADFRPEDFANYDLIIVGGSTVGADNWTDASGDDQWGPFFIRMKNAGISLQGKKVALFGLGNQVLYPDHFVNSMRFLHDELKHFEPDFIGRWSSEGYSFNDSDALEGSEFLGLALDEDSEGHLSEGRVENWLAQILEEAGE